MTYLLITLYLATGGSYIKEHDTLEKCLTAARVVQYAADRGMQIKAFCVPATSV